MVWRNVAASPAAPGRRRCAHGFDQKARGFVEPTGRDQHECQLSEGELAVGLQPQGGAKGGFGLGEMALREQHDTQIVLRLREVRIEAHRFAQARSGLVQPSGRSQCIAEIDMRDGIAGLGGDTLPKARDGTIEVALGLQGIAEGEMAGGGSGIEPDRGPEALDRLVQAAEPAEDGAEIAVEVRPRPDCARSPAAADRWRRRAAGRCRDAGQQELRVGVSGVRRQHRAAELICLGQAAGLLGGGGTPQQAGHIAWPGLRGRAIRHVLQRDPRVDPGAVLGA